MNINTMLPVEMLDRVFSMLEPRDRMEAVKVCHIWKEVCEYPGLWSWLEMRINSSNLHLVSKMATSRRLQFIKTIFIKVMESQMTEEHLVSIMQWKMLKYLRITLTNIRAWNPKLSAALFSKLDKLSLIKVDLTKIQLETLFTMMKEGTILQSLEMVFMDLSNVAPNLFTALTAVSEVVLVGSEL